MNRFVRNLLPLCVLAVMVSPVHAADAEAAKCDLGSVSKGYVNEYTEKAIVKLLESNDCIKEAKEKLKEIADKLTNGKGGEDSEKPELPQEPGDSEEPKDPDIDEPEQPDIDEPENPDIDEPETPELPGEPQEPQEPELPGEPELPQEPEEPGLPVEPENPEPPVEPENPGIEEPGTEEPEIKEPELPSSVSAYAKEVARLVNQERAAAGLDPLKLNTELSKVADVKAADMRDRNYFSHTSPTYGSPFDMMKQFGITYKSAGENIAKGQKTPASVMNSWMNSSGHKANILSTSYTEIGVGYVTDSNGTTYWVQMFIRP